MDIECIKFNAMYIFESKLINLNISKLTLININQKFWMSLIKEIFILQS